MSLVTENQQRPAAGVDDALTLDAIYYSAQVPRDLYVLTVLGAVFDKVYFPGVYMPKAGFDQGELDKEIARIEAITSPMRDRDSLLGILHFIRHARTLDGFCVFTGDGERPFDRADAIPQKMVADIYEAIHGPNRPGWTPVFSTNHHKGMPGSDEHVTYPGSYHYLVGALLESAQTGIPLLNDLPGLPIPGLDDAAPTNNAKILSAIVAIECTKLMLPEMPVLSPQDIMEFRAENAKILRAFRRSMLRYAGDLNSQIAGLSRRDFEAKTKFFVQTEIVPVVDELRDIVSSPGRPWYKRAIDFARVIPELGAACLTMEPNALIAKVLATYAGQLFTELSAKGDQRDALKRSGLYYLLRLQERHSERLS